MKKKILTVVIVVAVIGLIVALFTIPKYLENKKREESTTMHYREIYLKILGSEDDIFVEGKLLFKILENEQERKILLEDHVTAVVPEENFDNTYFKIFVWHMTSNKEWNYMEVRESLEKEIAMLADKEHGVAVFYDRETELGGYSHWAFHEGVDTKTIISRIRGSIIELGSGSDIEDQTIAESLGVSVSEFKEIIRNLKQYPEHWEALYRLTKEKAVE